MLLMSKTRKRAFLLILIFAVLAIQLPVSFSLGAENKYSDIQSQEKIPNIDALKSSLPNNLISHYLIIIE